MAEEAKTSKEPPFPQTWDELTHDARFAGIPDLTQPQDLSVTQSAMMAVFTQRYDERLDLLDKSGAFTPGATVKDPDRATVAMAEAVDYANMFFRDLADTARWDEWTKGRELPDLFVLFVLLVRFYREQLGKSSASKRPSPTAA